MNIEFVEPRLPSRRAWTALLGVAALAAVLFATARVLAARAQTLDDAWRAGEQARTRPVPMAAPRKPPPYAADAQRALERAALPGAAALGELEAVAVAGVALQSIEIDMAVRRATVQLRAPGQAVLDDYLGQLNAGLALPAWHVERIAVGERVGPPPPGAAPNGAPALGELSVTLARTL